MASIEDVAEKGERRTADDIPRTTSKKKRRKSEERDRVADWLDSRQEVHTLPVIQDPARDRRLRAWKAGSSPAYYLKIAKLAVKRRRHRRRGAAYTGRSRAKTTNVVVDVERYVKLADLCATELAHEATRRIPTQV
ncbi:hypothetical protein WN51_03077 [Melipona quadrifasciata]|uniref:Uncharacterized protein n=1 Tax=Melipona quadrifasciata TaxID=166423 RepID=A0A0M8ZWI7_9HYME|nr:hypothetical protein WN51_03077 [Melipona quadrifasciata]